MRISAVWRALLWPLKLFFSAISWLNVLYHFLAAFFEFRTPGAKLIKKNILEIWYFYLGKKYCYHMPFNESDTTEHFLEIRDEDRELISEIELATGCSTDGLKLISDFNGMVRLVTK